MSKSSGVLSDSFVSKTPRIVYRLLLSARTDKAKAGWHSHRVLRVDTKSFPVRTRQDDTVIASYVWILSFPARTKQDDAVISSYVWVQSHVLKEEVRIMQSSRLTYGYRVTYKEEVRMIVILSYKWIQSLRIKRRGQDNEAMECYVWVESHVFKQEGRTVRSSRLMYGYRVTYTKKKKKRRKKSGRCSHLLLRAATELCIKKRSGRCSDGVLRVGTKSRI